MKNSVVGLLTGLAFITTLNIHAQTVQENLSLIESTTPMPADQAPAVATFYSAQHAPGSAVPWPPLPANVYGLPIWNLGDNVFLLSDQDLDYSAPMTSQSSMTTMSAMDVPNPGGGGGSGGTNYLSNSLVLPDFGSNLWIQIESVSGGTVNLLISNSQPDVRYELKGIGDLASTNFLNWNSYGFCYGSELTNFTTTSITVTDWPNLFLGVLSWEDTTGSGIPDWWWEKYGISNQDPYADPDGDGWNNLQEFQNGTDPNLFNPSPAPQVTAFLNADAVSASINWSTAQGPVIGYTVERTDNAGVVDYSFSADTNGFLDDVSMETPDPFNNDSLDVTYRVQARYNNGVSQWSSPASLNGKGMIGTIVPGPNGLACLAVSTLPVGTTAIRITEKGFDNNSGDYMTLTNFDIPIENFTNGICFLSNNILPAESYDWLGKAIGTNGDLTANTVLCYNYISPADELDYAWIVPPFFDGRAQLRQNLIFQLRAAVMDYPFQCYVGDSYFYRDGWLFTCPTNYAYAGFYGLQYSRRGNPISLDSFLPFEENYFDRNFVFDPSYLDSSGHTTTGVGISGDQYETIGGISFIIDTSQYYWRLFEAPLAFQFSAPTVNGAAISSVLTTNETRWLCSWPIDSLYDFSEIDFALTNNARNLVVGYFEFRFPFQV